MDQDDPRATQVYNTSTQQQQITQVLHQLQKNNHINAFFVLTHYLDCPEIKNQPDFFQMLFSKNLDVVMQLIEWMLIPKQIVKRKKIKANVESYPYQCREFLKDNWCFYEQLYIAIRKKKIEFKNLFKFLHPEYYDKTTIYTALGYFSDVFGPFLKYEFSGSFNLIKSLQLELTPEQQQNQTYCIMKIFNQNLIDQLITYCHYDAIFQFIKNLILNCLEDSTQIYQAKKIFYKLLRECMIENVFGKFSDSFIFQNQQNEEINRCYQLYESLGIFLKQILQNIQPTQQLPRITTCLIEVLVQSNLIEYCLRQLPQSRYCGMTIKDHTVNNGMGMNIKLYSSASLKFQDGKISIQSDEKDGGISQSHNSSRDKDSSGVVNGGFLDVEENQMVQSLIRIIYTLVSIFHQMPKTFRTKIQQQLVTPLNQPAEISFTSVTEFIDNDKFLFAHPLPQERNSKSSIHHPNPITPPSPNPFASTSTPLSPTPLSPKKLKKCHKEITFQQYTTLLLLYHQQIQQIFNILQFTIKFVYNIPTNPAPTQKNTTTSPPNFSASTYSLPQHQSHNKIIPFSSGQNIKSISFMKYQYFKLLYECLVVWQASLGEQYNSNSNKLPIQIRSAQSLKQIQPQKQPQQKSQNSPLEKFTTPQKQTQQQIKEVQQSQQNIQVITLPTFRLPKEKLHLIQIIKKYLIENRWNNITQTILIQICHKLIISNYEYIKKNLEKDKLKKFSDSFLAYLIENFSKRDFVFLNTVKFTPQGNLYALYSIARDLAHSLNGANQLVIFLNQFEPWKKFILNDLKNYEEKLFPNAIKPQFDDSFQDQSIKLKVDQADSIKKLIQNISTTKKWPTKNAKTKKKSRATSSHRNSVDLPKTKSTIEEKSSNFSNKKKTEAESQFEKYLGGEGKKVREEVVVGTPPTLSQQMPGKSSENDNSKLSKTQQFIIDQRHL